MTTLDSLSVFTARARRTWPAPRAFDRVAILQKWAAQTTAREEIVGEWNAATQSVDKRAVTWHYPVHATAWGIDEPNLSVEEAWFHYTVLWKKGATTIEDATSEPAPASALERVRADLLGKVPPTWFEPRVYWRIVASMLSRSELAELVADGRVFVHKVDGGASIITGWSDQVAFREAFYVSAMPYFDEAQRDIVANALAPHLETGWDPNRLRLATATGRFDDLVRRRIEELTEKQTPGLLEILFAHADPSLLRAHAPRLDAILRFHAPPIFGFTDVTAAYIRGWLDRFGSSELDWVARSIQALGNRGEANTACKELAQLTTPEVARCMLALKLESKAQKEASKWLDAHPDAARAGLAVLAAETGKLADAARAHLEALAKLGSVKKGKAKPKAPAETPPATWTRSDLPEILVSPPWDTPKPKARKRDVPRPPITLESAKIPTSFEVRDGDFEGYDDYRDYAKRHIELGASIARSAWEARIAARQPDTAIADGLALILSGPEDLAAQWLMIGVTEGRVEKLSHWDAKALAVGVAARGASFVPAFIALLRRPAAVTTFGLDTLEDVLMCGDGTDIANGLLDVMARDKKLAALTHRWARRYPRALVTAAIPRAIAGEQSAIAALEELVRVGRLGTIEEVARAYEVGANQPVLSALGAVAELDPLACLPAKMPSLPSFADVLQIKTIHLRSSGAELPPDAVRNILVMLSISGAERRYAGLDVVRAVCTPSSLRDFAWDVFDAWLTSGAEPKEIWALHALGHLGDDETVRRIVPLLQQWPKENASARAVHAISVLCNIGTDLALMSLDRIADSVRHASIQKEAKRQVLAIAERRGLSRDELADRLVPDLGLDARGELTLDFGARWFVASLDEQLVPVLRTREGKRLASLPKPAAADDASKAKAATAAFKALKKDAAAIASGQIQRLERAMVMRRRWSTTELHELFLDKPIMRTLACRLVWVTYDAAGQRTSTFRVDADGSLADVEDAKILLGEGARVGLLHPIDAQADELARWGGVLTDYELLQPFAQLGREVFHLEDSGVQADALLGFHPPRTLPAPTLVFGLERQGWKRGAVEDAGMFQEHTKTLGGLLVRVTYSGNVAMGYIDASEALTLERVVFLRFGETVPVRSVEPILVSEVLRDLALVSL